MPSIPHQIYHIWTYEQFSDFFRELPELTLATFGEHIDSETGIGNGMDVEVLKLPGRDIAFRFVDGKSTDFWKVFPETEPGLAVFGFVFHVCRGPQIRSEEFGYAVFGHTSWEYDHN